MKNLMRKQTEDWEWRATSGMHDDGSHFEWVIVTCEIGGGRDGLYFSVANSTAELLPEGADEMVFGRLGDAELFCQIIESHQDSIDTLMDPSTTKRGKLWCELIETSSNDDQIKRILDCLDHVYHEDDADYIDENDWQKITDAIIKKMRDGFIFDKKTTGANHIIKKLRAFANELMDEWPGGCLDGGDLQEIAVKHELLIPTARYKSCCEQCQNNEYHECCSCACVEYYTTEEWQEGITCYRKTELLKGDN